MALIEARRTTRAGLSSVPAHLGPAMALVQHLRFVDVGRPRQAVERLPDLAVRYRHLRILMHALPITASEIRFGRRGLRRRDQPFDLSAHRRGLVVGRRRVGFEKDVDVDDQLGERAQPREVSVARQ